MVLIRWSGPIVAFVVVLGLASLPTAARAGRSDAHPGVESSPSAMPTLAPPPVVKPVPDFDGVTDLSNDYERGAIKLKVRPGRSIADVLARHGVTGSFRHLSPPPFSEWDIAAGIDRDYRVEVPVGTEKSEVVRLSQAKADFEWVELVWLPNGVGAL